MLREECMINENLLMYPVQTDRCCIIYRYLWNFGFFFIFILDGVSIILEYIYNVTHIVNIDYGKQMRYLLLI